MKHMKFNYDVHLHTNLSACASSEITLQSYLDYAEGLNLTAIGISNHLWDAEISGASKWYAPQNFSHISKIKHEMIDIPHRIPVYFGCEADYTHENKLTVSEATADQLDYILVSHSHTHMDVIMPKRIFDTEQKHAAYLVNSFLGVVADPLSHRFASIAHPFSVKGGREGSNAILSRITDQQFRECVLAAKENGIGLEVNISTIVSSIDGDNFSDSEMLRFFSIAKACGARFTWGSDSHRIYDLRLPVVYRFLDACRIDTLDFMTVSEIMSRNKR